MDGAIAAIDDAQVQQALNSILTAIITRVTGLAVYATTLEELVVQSLNEGERRMKLFEEIEQELQQVLKDLTTASGGVPPT